MTLGEAGEELGMGRQRQQMLLTAGTELGSSSASASCLFSALSTRQGTKIPKFRQSRV